MLEKVESNNIKQIKLTVSTHFHPLEVVSRYRDPQLQVVENDGNMSADLFQ